MRQMFSDVIPEKYVELGKVLDRFVKEEDFEELYSPDMGRPSVSPVILVKVTILQYPDNVSDRKSRRRRPLLPEVDVRVEHTPEVGWI
ncbi:MAG: transposase [Candidatus Freyarchaeota archaeon]|nr:transposase [Candidatus Jordarchaeia archaeon]